MIFAEMLKELHANRSARRTSWDEEGANSGYVVIMPGMAHVWRILVKPTPNAGNYMPNIADLEADDWEIL